MTILHTKIDPETEEYLLNNSQYDNKDIDDVYNSAYGFDEPYMQISKLQATALQFFIGTAQIKNVIEVGTFVGFSAFSMAKVMPENIGNLVTIEINKNFWSQAEKNQWEYFKHCRDNNIKPSGCVGNIKFINDDAKNYLGSLNKQEAKKIDMFFLDGDKENYVFYLDWAIENLRSGAYFLIDNALFKGGVINGREKLTQQIRDLTIKLKNSKKFDYFFIPVGDCMIVAVKK